LRTVVSGAAANSTITFNSSLSGQIIQLTSGEIPLNKNLTIDASSLANGVQINGHHSSRIFNVGSATVVLNSLTITNGLSSAGGGILNAGTLTLNRCSVVGNSVSSGGGGGGIYNNLGTLTLNQCTVASNTATIGGGAGGGIFDLSGGSPVILNNCTVSGNSANTGGAFQSVNIGSNNVTFFNSILAGNNSSSGAAIINTTPFLLGNNLTTGNPLLAPLGNYGGPTPTMPPVFGSSAIDAGSDSALSAPYLFTTDQRGLTRPGGPHVDIGSVEIIPLVVTTNADSGPGSLRTAVGAAAAGSTITFAANLSGQTIVLTGGEIVLSQNILIDASSLPAGVTLSGNNANRIFNLSATANITLSCLTIIQGTTADAGGAIYTSAGSSLHIQRCTFTQNSALEGGAILNDGTLVMENCTMSGNNGGYGGALQCRYLTTLTHCTIDGNNAPNGGGGIFNKGSTLTLNNTIVGDNTPAVAGADIYSQLAALVFSNANIVPNLFHDRPTASDIGPAPITSAPVLYGLFNYGGPTQTMPPMSGSPAIDAAGATSLTIEQRGYQRVIGAGPDIGATEYRFGNTTVSTAADSGTGSLRYAVNYTLPGAIIVFAPNLSGQTIALTNGELVIPWDLTIDASLLSTNIIIDANHSSRIFRITNNATVTLTSLKLINAVFAGANGTNGFGGDPQTDGGDGSDGTSAQGGGIYNDGHLTLNQVTLAMCGAFGGSGGLGGNGWSGGNGGNGAAGQGGAIFNSGSLTLNQVTISGCAAAGGSGGIGGVGGSDNNQDLFVGLDGGSGGISQPGQGGGVYSSGSLIINQSTLSSNTCSGGSGGPGGNSYTSNTDNGYAYPGPSLDGSPAQGGAIYNSGYLFFAESTATRNSANGGRGGHGAVGINNNQGNFVGFLFNNPGNGSPGEGGALYNAGTLTVRQSTLTGNQAADGIGGSDGGNGINGSDADSLGGGLFSINTFTAYNSIIALNSATTYANLFLTGSNSFVGNNLTDANPILAPLGNYGGPTQTMPPLPGSPAIDAGNDFVFSASDQRGYARLSGAHPDIGAVELQLASQPFPVKSPTWLNSQPQFKFSNLVGGSFTVYASTNLSVPFTNWVDLGPAIETPPGSGQFQFTDTKATNYTKRFYRVTSP